jgi:hypothetical protein
MPLPNEQPTLEELKSMSEGKLMEEVDKLYSRPNTSEFYLLLARRYEDELARRPQVRQTKTMIRLTWAIAALTVALLVGLVVQICLALSC